MLTVLTQSCIHYRV